MKANTELMYEARKRLANNWTPPVGTSALYFVTNAVLAPIGLVTGGPLRVGLSQYFLNFSKGKKPDYAELFDGFKVFAQAFVAFLLVSIFTFLWSLLLIVPGIIAAISYSQTFFILADKKGVRAGEAIRRSKAMMQGHKWQYFCLYWRFFGWFVLCLLTFGIGFLWLAPYVQTSLANFYREVK